MINNQRLHSAQDYFNKAYELHVKGNITEAIENYKISIDLFPTAEAHTFLGWAYSMQGKLNDAINECYTAIDIDPDLGNPYNDIGNYLFNQGKYDESVYWFEKAIDARKYNLRHFPYYNLGKVFEKKGEWYKALDYFRLALKIKSDYEPAQHALIRITTLLN